MKAYPRIIGRAAFLVLSAFSLGFSFAQEPPAYLPPNYNLDTTLGPDGKIPTEFWSYQISINQSSAPITWIETHFNLLKQKPIDLEDGDPQDPGLIKDKAKLDRLILVLQRNGVLLDDENPTPEEAVSGFAVSQVGESGFYIWRVDTNYFLVNPLKPSQAAFLTNADGDGGRLGSVYAQTLPTNGLRLFCNIWPMANGCGASAAGYLKLFDINLSQGTWIVNRFPDTSCAEDLNNDGNYELVIAPDVGEMTYFSWVYAWDGTQWMDRRADFWKLYQHGSLEPFTACPTGLESPVEKALRQSITKGDPLPYWQIPKKNPAAATAEAAPWLALAKKSLAAKDYAAVIGDYQKALGADPANPKIYTYLGYAQILNHQQVEAQNNLSRAIALDGQSALARYNMALWAWVYHDATKPSTLPTAVAQIIQAFDLDPSLKSIARQTANIKGLLATPEFLSAIYWKNFKASDGLQMSPGNDLQTAQVRWLNHDLWAVAPQPVTLEHGTILALAEKVKITNVQIGDSEQTPIRLVLQDEEGRVDSIQVGISLSPWRNQFPVPYELGDPAWDYFSCLFSETDPRLIAKQYMAQTGHP